MIRKLKEALGKHYELQELIGRGGFAEVFKVRDQWLKRDLALKAIRPDLVVSETLMARFRREAEAVANLRHPHIVPIYDIGEAEGIMYILMPLIKGESLKSLLVRDGRRPIQEARRILLEAAGALGSAHEAGIVHRDIKPENIMLEGKSRRVLVMDFGIAKVMDAAGDSIADLERHHRRHPALHESRAGQRRPPPRPSHRHVFPRGGRLPHAHRVGAVRGREHPGDPLQADDGIAPLDAGAGARGARRPDGGGVQGHGQGAGRPVPRYRGVLGGARAPPRW